MIWKTICVFMFAVGALASPTGFVNPIMNMCRAAGAEDKPDELLSKYFEFTQCIGSVFDIEIMKMDIYQAYSSGSVKPVFAKYCPKASQISPCLLDFSMAMETCSTTFLRYNRTAASIGIDLVIEYFCYGDGERVEKFLKDGGMQCLQTVSQTVKSCIEGMKNFVTSSEFNWNHEKSCFLLGEYHDCVINALDECHTSTPKDMLRSLFRIVQKVEGCQ